jgi:protein-tyrosine phosphatase
MSAVRTSHVRAFLKRMIKAPLRDLWWALYGPSLNGLPQQHAIESVLFICKGNICRSPFAEYAARSIAAKGCSEVVIGSAGLQVSSKEPPPPEAIKAAEHFEIDMSGHLSSGLTTEHVKSYDAIFAMEGWQLKKLRFDYPKDKHKFFLLPLLDNAVHGQFRSFHTYNIKDPFGGSVVEFVRCYRRIQSCVGNVIGFNGFKEAQRGS